MIFRISSVKKNKLMKYRLLFFLSLLFFISLPAIECKKHKTPSSIDELSTETQTGANTFGLINAEVFLPKGASLSQVLQCVYQYLNATYSKGYFFQLSAIHNIFKNIKRANSVYRN